MREAEFDANLTSVLLVSSTWPCMIAVCSSEARLGMNVHRPTDAQDGV